MSREFKLDLYDWRGGVNRSFSEDALDLTELRRAENLRIGALGGLEKRGGSERIHDTSLGNSTVTGLHGRFDAPGGRQVVAISANGHLYYKLLGATDFTDNGAVPALPNGNKYRMRPFRVGATIRLYMAGGQFPGFSSGLFQWTGAVLTEIVDGPLATVKLTDICPYKSRLFGIAGKTLYGSKIIDPTIWNAGAGGVAEDVETYDTEPLVALGLAGSSLLLFKEDNIARFTGADPATITIAKDTEGVSEKVGCIAPMTVINFPEGCFFLAAEGAYLATEAGIEELGLKIEKDLDEATRVFWNFAVAQWYKPRREIWLDVPGPVSGSSGLGAMNRRYVWNQRTRAWSGPWTIRNSVLAEYDEPNTGERRMLAAGDPATGSTGWVTKEDRPVALVDRSRLLAGGVGFQMVAEFPIILAGDPNLVKSLANQDLTVQADLGAVYVPATPSGGLLTVEWESEMGTGSVDIPSTGPGMKDYPFQLRGKGRRLKVRLKESTQEATQIAGIHLEGTVSLKP